MVSLGLKPNVKRFIHIFPFGTSVFDHLYRKPSCFLMRLSTLNSVLPKSSLTMNASSQPVVCLLCGFFKHLIEQTKREIFMSYLNYTSLLQWYFFPRFKSLKKPLKVMSIYLVICDFLISKTHFILVVIKV